MKSQDLLSHLTFELDHELFAINVGKVVNILEMTRITKIPNAPEYFKGVINLRGKVLPVIEGRLKLGLPTTDITRDTAIIVLTITLNEELVSVGFMVDSVHSVLEIDPSVVLPPPSIGDKYKSDFITGIYNYTESMHDKASSEEDEILSGLVQFKATKGLEDNKLILILDIDKIFSTTEIVDIKTHAPNQIEIVNE